jgi:putative membrane protein
MFREIIGRVMICVLWASCIVYVDHVLDLHWPISSAIHGLVGVALGMLLVFRTNSSYERWWEGRKLWGSIINESRNLGRLLKAHLGSDPALRDQTLCWTAAFASAAMHRLRGGIGLGAAAERLPPGEVARTLAAEHVPLAVAQRITGGLAAARQRGLISDYLMTAIDQNVQLLVDYLGGCERIHATPLPFAYMVHVRRVLILYAFALPPAFVDTYGWGTILATFVVSYVFFGIEEIGVEIEDPFGFDDNDLPLERFCTLIERDLLAHLPEPALAPLAEAG